MADGLTAADAALLRDDGMFGGGGAFFWVFALLLLSGGGFGGFGGNRDYVTQADLNAQTQALQMQTLAGQIANNNYETAQIVNQQTMQLIDQNNTNLINAIQGFNNLGLQINNQTNVLSSQIQALGAQLNECCCSIKTQMLQDRLAEKETELATARAAIDNAAQSQYLLGQMGKWVANAPAATA